MQHRSTWTPQLNRSTHVSNTPIGSHGTANSGVGADAGASVEKVDIFYVKHHPYHPVY